MCAIHSITVEQVQGDSRKGATGKTNVTTLGCWPFLVIIGWRPTGLEMQKLHARALGHLPQLAPLIALPQLAPLLPSRKPLSVSSLALQKLHFH